MSRNRSGRCSRTAVIGAVVVVLTAAGNVAYAEPEPIELEVLLSAAASSSAELREVELRKAESRLLVDAARAERLPTVGSLVDISYLTNPMNPIELRAGELGTYEIPGVTVELPPEDLELFPGMEPTLFRLQLSVEQPLYTWGKIDTGIALAESLVGIRELEYQQSVEEVSADVRTRFFAVAQLNRMIDTVSEQVKLAGQLVEVARTALETGVAVRSDVLRARVGLQEAIIGRRQLAYERDRQLVALAAATGLDELLDESAAARFTAEPSAAWELDPLPSVASLQERAHQESPGLAALSSAHAAAGLQEQLDQITASARPDIGLALNFSLEGSRVPLLQRDWFGQDESGLVASLGVQATLYDGGRRRVTAQQSGLAADQAALYYDVALQEIDRTIAETLLSIEYIRARLRYLDVVAEKDADDLRIARATWEAGIGDRATVLKAELTQLATQLERQSRELDIIKDVLLLEALIGGPVFR